MRNLLLVLFLLAGVSLWISALILEEMNSGPLCEVKLTSEDVEPLTNLAIEYLKDRPQRQRIMGLQPDGSDLSFVLYSLSRYPPPPDGVYDHPTDYAATLLRGRVSGKKGQFSFR